MYDEDELLSLSALQHLVFCERQAALIHVERQWADNALTIEGSHLHRAVDEDAPLREVRGDRVIVRRVPLRSLRLGLVGRADVVELYRGVAAAPAPSDRTALLSAVRIRGLDGKWALRPVEYKRGRPKKNACDAVQLCAQALCLEEMLGVAVPEGALFYGKQRRRHPVTFTAGLREQTHAAAKRLRTLVTSGMTPRAEKGSKCKRCSFLELCLPGAMEEGRLVATYMAQIVTTSSQTSEGGK
jgi:CRISPR-associated exonuclease Cas4